MPVPIPTALKLKLRRNKLQTLNPILPSLQLEDDYVNYLDGKVTKVTDDINKNIKPYILSLINAQTTLNTFLAKVTAIDGAFLDADNPYTNSVNEAKSKLQEVINKAKEDFLNNFDDSVLYANLFISRISSYGQQKLFNQITKKYGTSKAKFLLIDDVRKPFESAVRDNVELIRNVSDKYYDDVYKSVMTSFLHISKVGDTVDKKNSLVNRLINDREGITRRRAELIGRDQSAKVTRALNAERYKNLGITQSEWCVADFSSRLRPSHRKLNGVIFDLDKGAEKDDGTFIYPSQEVNCRCSERPIIPDGLFDD